MVGVSYRVCGKYIAFEFLNELYCLFCNFLFFILFFSNKQNVMAIKVYRKDRNGCILT